MTLTSNGEHVTIFRQYDRAGLDREYDNAAKIPAETLKSYRARWAEQSRRARETLLCDLDLAYGPSAGERLVAQLDLVAGVADKSMAIGRVSDAERLVSSAVSSFVELVQNAETARDWEAIGRVYTRLERILPRLEAVTGKGWTRCVDVVKDRVSKPMVPPRGQA